MEASLWQAATLDTVASVAISGVDKHVLPGEQTILLCNYLDVYRNRRLRTEHRFSVGSATASEINRFTLKKGDVVITKDSETPDDIGVPCLIADELQGVVCGYHLAVIRPGQQLVPAFLLQVMQSDFAKRHFLKAATGLTRFGLATRSIQSLPVPMPNPAEQSGIAYLLDAVDLAVEKGVDAVAAATELHCSLLNECLANGIGSDGLGRDRTTRPDAFHRTAMGWLPNTWQPSDIRAEFEIRNGITLNEAQRERLPKWRYLRVANVQRDQLSLDDVKVLEAKDSEVAPRLLAANDLLVVEGHADRMQIGRCALVTADAVGMTFQNHLFRLRSKGKLLPEFACLWLNSSHAQRYWNAMCATSSGLNTINQKMLKRLSIPVPDKDEQKRIASLLGASKARIAALEAKVAALRELKKSLLHDLLTGAKRLDPKRILEAAPE